MLDPSHFLSQGKEKEHYDLHQNDINDHAYQNFVSPIVNGVLETYSSTHKGLDFGAGSGPVITHLLVNNEYDIVAYDPYFCSDKKLLEKRYDYIVCCEVMEHFYNPAKEFGLLKSLLLPNGTLYCKTKLYNPTINFTTWWYKNDPTHVFFYSNNTLLWIKNQYKFESVTINDAIITFKNT